MEYKYDGIKVLKACSNCTKHDNYICEVWNHEVVWCGTCPNHELDTKDIDSSKLEIFEHLKD